MRIEALRNYVELCKTLNFRKTASKLHITQPALSSRIASLEKELGVELICRSYPISLTAAGKTLLENAVPLLEQYDSMVQDCRRAHSHSKSRLTVKRPESSSAVLSSLFHELLIEFAADNPEIEVAFAPASSNNVLEDLLSGELDCALTYCFGGSIEHIARHDEALARRVAKAPSLRFVRLGEIELYLSVSRENPLAQAERVSLDDIRGYRVPYVYKASKAEAAFSLEVVNSDYDLRLSYRPLLDDELSSMSIPLDEIHITERRSKDASGRIVQRRLEERPTAPLFLAVNAAENDAAQHAHRHDDQYDAEYRIELADDLVDGQQRCQHIVNQYHDNPEGRVQRIRRQPGQKRGRRVDEYRSGQFFHQLKILDVPGNGRLRSIKSSQF